MGRGPLAPPACPTDPPDQYTSGAGSLDGWGRPAQRMGAPMRTPGASARRAPARATASAWDRRTWLRPPHTGLRRRGPRRRSHTRGGRRP